jgi:hypothetical protein
VTGDGPAKAARVARGLCERYRPAALVGIGAAGALTASLAPSDVVASARLIDGSLAVPAPDPLLLSRATAAGARPATLVTVRRPAATVAAKRELSRGAGELAAVGHGVLGVGLRGVGRRRSVRRRARDPGRRRRGAARLPGRVRRSGGGDCGARPSSPARSRILRRFRHWSGCIGGWLACAERLAEFLVDGFFRCEKA